MIKKVHLIVNPAAGRPEPILHIINTIFHKHNVKWDVSLTKPNNVKKLVEDAVKSKPDAIAVYGGDGTVAEVGDALFGKNIPLAVIPGGTANIFAMELEIPSQLEKAVKVIVNKKSVIKTIDAAEVNGRHFFLRVGLGFEAELVKFADRSFKTNVGWLAYALSGFKALLSTKPTVYQLTLDKEKITVEGLSLVIANAGNLGVAGLPLFPKIKINDGLLDVILIRAADIKQLFLSQNKQKKHKLNPLQLFKHWQVKEIKVRHRPSQSVQLDGEVFDRKILDIKVKPKALKVIVPA